MWSGRFLRSSMALKKKISCLWTLGLCLAASKCPEGPSAKDQQFIYQCVNIHNQLRGTVNPPAADMKHMVWDDGLAKLAKAWANKCIFGHNTCLGGSYECSNDFEYVGENIWLGGLRGFTPRSAITAWYNETVFYDFDSLACTKVCGHYTQVVWANSYKLGCAISICPHLRGPSTAIFVCNYGPAGNFANMRPYTKGASCSLCSEEERCVKKLCQNEAEMPLAKAPRWTACYLLSLGSVVLRIF